MSKHARQLHEMVEKSVDKEWDKAYKQAIRKWQISTVVAIAGWILLAFNAGLHFDFHNFIVIALFVLSFASTLYSLWKLLLYISGFVWEFFRSIHPVFGVGAAIIFPPILLLMLIGWVSLNTIEDEIFVQKLSASMQAQRKIEEAVAALKAQLTPEEIEKVEALMEGGELDDITSLNPQEIVATIKEKLKSNNETNHL